MTVEKWWQSQTFRALVLYFVTMIANAVARRWGYSLNTEEIAGLTVTLVGFIVGRQYKQGKLLDNEVHPIQLPAHIRDPEPSKPSGIKTVAPLILILCLPALSGCALFNRVGHTAELAAPKVLDCAGTSAAKYLPALLGEVATVIATALITKDVKIENVINDLLKTVKDDAYATGRDFMPCAIAEVLRAWQMAGPGAGLPVPSDPKLRQEMKVKVHDGLAHLNALGYLTE